MKTGEIVDDRYVILSILGEGGVGTVYRAREIGLERLIALKFLQASLLADQASRDRFFREGQVLSTLSHPNLPQLYRFGIWQDLHPYIAMEYIEGRSLRDILDEAGAISVSRAINIICQVCDGLASVHHAGIIHRDLKPSNLMLITSGSDIAQHESEIDGDRTALQCSITSILHESEELRLRTEEQCKADNRTESLPEVAKIVDFGLAGFTARLPVCLTQSGELLGTILYMSPEQCMGKQLDESADIYSLGCILYECLTGTPPFVGPNPVAVMRQHASELVPPLPKKLGGKPLSPGLTKVIEKALAKDPLQRYRTIEQFDRDLKLIEKNRTEEMLAVLEPVTQLTKKKETRLLTGGALVALLGVLSLSYLYIGQPHRNIDFMAGPTSKFKPNVHTPYVALKRAQDTMVLSTTRTGTEAVRLLQDAARLSKLAIEQIPASDKALHFQSHLLLAEIHNRLYVCQIEQDPKLALEQQELMKDEALLAASFARESEDKYYRQAAGAYKKLGEMLVDSDGAQAKVYFEKALKIVSSGAKAESFILRDHLPGKVDDDEDTDITSKIANCLYRRGEVKKAETLLMDDINQSEKKYGGLGPRIVECVRELVAIFNEQGRKTESIALIKSTERELGRSTQSERVDPNLAAELHESLAELAFSSGDIDLAMGLTEKSVASLNRTTIVWQNARLLKPLKEIEDRASQIGRSDIIHRVRKLRDHVRYISNGVFEES